MQLSYDSLGKFLAGLGLAAIVGSASWWRIEDDKAIAANSSANAARAELRALLRQSKVQIDIAFQLANRKSEVLAAASQLGSIGKIGEANQVLDTLSPITKELESHLSQASEIQARVSEREIEVGRLDALDTAQHHVAEKYTNLSLFGLALGVGVLSFGCFRWGRSEGEPKRAIKFPSLPPPTE